MSHSIDDIKKSRGRPKADTSAVMLRMPIDDLAAVDAFAAAEGDKPGRPEAIRRIVRAWLTNAGYLKST